MATLNTHNTESITVERKIYEDFIIYNIHGVDMDGNLTTVQFFSNDMDLDIGDVQVNDRR